jgi:16S rRNA (uracil1498-N3)-methyltransferase
VLASAFSADRLVFAVGPEGGLEPSEVEVARAQGFSIVNLGELILRTETVCAAVLGAALLASG